MLCTNCAARFLTKAVCASCIVPGCCAQVALCKLLHASALCKLLCASALSKLLCASALRQLLRASALRMWSVQVGLCKLLCASALCKCSVQVALRKLLCASDSAQVALRKCCRSCGNVLRVLFLYLKVAIFQPELRECAPRTTFVLKSCDFPAGAAGPRTTFVLKSCDFQAGAAADQGGIEPATAGLRKQEHKPRDNFQRPSREQQNRTAPQRERFDTHDLRRGFAETKKNSHGATARALRHARSPQRVHPGMSKAQKTSNLCTSSFCTSTTPIPAEGRAGTAKNRKKPQAFAPRPRRSPQRVARGRGSRGHRKKKRKKKRKKFLHLGHADVRRGSCGHIKKR